MKVLESLAALREHAVVSDLDVAFARLMARLAGDAKDEIALAACLASFSIGEGNVCADLSRYAGRPTFGTSERNSGPASPVAPELAHWRAALRDSGVVGRPGEAFPLLLDERDRLYLQRYWEYEQEIASDLLARASAAAEPVDEGLLRSGLRAAWEENGDAPARAGGGQRRAAVVALLRRLCVISGGPGTGKTTTVVRILALLAQQARALSAGKSLRIALAAPTGKAAARMQEAVRQAKSRLAGRIAAEVLDDVPESASTIHRLLGPRLESVYFRHDRDRPLPVDVLVVDEASMVDVALMAKLLRATPPSAKVILVGDKDQLASIEAGSVLGDVCGDAPGFSGAWRTRVEGLCALEPPRADAAASAAVPRRARRGRPARDEGLPLFDRIRPAEPALAPEDRRADDRLRDSIVLLRHSYRFGSDSGIGELARAVRDGDLAGALALLGGQRFGDVAFCELDSQRALRERLMREVVRGYAPAIELARRGEPVARIFEALNRFRVLCAVRQGDFGTARVNEVIADALHDAGLIDRRNEWYVGRTVMITRNDYRLNLFNGDVGIALAEPDGRVRVHFEPAGEGERAFAPSRLPTHEPVLAMTIHKSQGSEFDSVVLLLPPDGSRILGRELLYTGITRARARVALWGRRESLLDAAVQPQTRSSGLRDALWGSPTLA